jgi:hypothetical protein
MSNADQYRAHARDCVIKAERAHFREDKISWLCMAQTWLGMIPEAQRTAADAIQAIVRDRGTGQAPSKSRHQTHSVASQRVNAVDERGFDLFQRSLTPSFSPTPNRAASSKAPQV